jgi:hypothetical protein
MSDDISLAHFIDFLCGLRKTKSYGNEHSAATVLPNLIAIEESRFAEQSLK